MLPTATPASTHPAQRGIDWRAVFMLPPQRRFSAEELRRAVPEPMSASVKLSALLNLTLPLAAMLWTFGAETPWQYSAAVVLSFVLLSGAALAAWMNPSGRVARCSYWLTPAFAAGIAVWVKPAVAHRPAVMALALLILMGALGLWFVIVHRHQYVAMRLAEMAERERAVEMARRLAAAQLEPHFLFNTLASLQHWVSTKDERAAPLLHALTGYLRATLPMFARPTHALADEAEAVRRYLQVMQARLGARLAWHIEIDPLLEALPLPPGLLLTLVENAVEHGIEPQVAGGEVRVSGRIEPSGAGRIEPAGASRIEPAGAGRIEPSGAGPAGAEAVLVVADTGPGPADDAREGLGLTNSRERLALTQGPAARLAITRGEHGGCHAELRLPWPAPMATTPARTAESNLAQTRASR